MTGVICVYKIALMVRGRFYDKVKQTCYILHTKIEMVEIKIDEIHIK